VTIAQFLIFNFYQFLSRNRLDRNLITSVWLDSVYDHNKVTFCFSCTSNIYWQLL